MKAMKKTVGILSLVIMLLSQIFTPLTYAATGDNEENPVIPEVLDEQEADIDEPENPVGESGEVVNPEQIIQEVISGGNTVVATGGTTQEEISDEDTEESIKDDASEVTEESEGTVTIENNMVVDAVKQGLGESEYNSEEVRGYKEHKNVKVEVYAETGAFEETPSLLIEPLESEKEADIKKAILTYNEDTESLDEEEIEQVAEEKITEVVAFDIKFLDKEKKEVQPREGMVRVEFNFTENKTLEETDEHEIKVYHLDNKDEKGNEIKDIEKMEIDEPEMTENKEDNVKELNEEQILTVIGEKFSIYTIVQQVREEGIQATTEDQLANFVYGEISIERPNSLSGEYPNIPGITIMDRNLGASTAGRGMDSSKNSYGYQYQRGNNYGFNQKVSSITPYIFEKIDISNITDGYSNNSWNTQDSWMSGTAQQIAGMWGGENDSASNYWGILGGLSNLQARQGPCPDGWHVPSLGEWGLLMKYWGVTNNQRVSLKSDNTFYFDINFAPERAQFLNAFKLPNANYRNGNKNNDLSSEGYYWTSTPINSTKAYSIKLFGDAEVNQNRKFIDGLSVRCFKNTYTPGEYHTITFDFNGGSGSTASINVINGLTGEKPTNPIKPYNKFLGWFLEGEETEFDFENTPINEDIELHARWRLVKVTYETNGGKFNDGEEEKVLDYNYVEIPSGSSNKSIPGVNNLLINLSIYCNQSTTVTLSGMQNSIIAQGSCGATTTTNNLILGDTVNIIGTNASYKGVAFAMPEIPTNEGKGFDGWYTEDGRKWTIGQDLDDITVYAHWREPIAILLPGVTFNPIIKNLAGGPMSNIYPEDNNIYKIKRYVGNAVPLNKKIISSVDSDIPVYAWFDNGTIYYYSEASTIYMNEDSSYMFYRLKNLNELDLTTLDTSNVTDMYSLFEGCQNLQTLDVSNFNTSKVKNMSRMFDECKSLREIDVSSFDTSNVTDMQSMFYRCSNLTGLDVSSFDTSNVTNMNNMFSHCENLQTLDLSNFSTSKVIDMSSMFYEDYTLREIDISNFDTSNVTTMSAMFYNNQSLREIDVSSFNTSKVTNMRRMFYYCSNVKTIYVSTAFDVSNVSNSTDMFKYTYNLVGGNGTKYNSSNITKAYAKIDKQGSVGYFTDKNEASVVYYVDGEKYEDSGNPEKEGYRFLGWYEDGTKKFNTAQNVDHFTEVYALFEKNDDIENLETKLLYGPTFNAVIKEVSNNLIGIDSNYIDEKIKKIVKAENIPNGANQRIVSTLDSDTPVYVWFDNGTLYYYSKANTIYLNEGTPAMFYNLKGIISLDLSNFNASKLSTTVGSMFAGSSNLEELILDGWDLRHISGISGIFSGTPSLKYISMSGRKIPENFSFGLGRSWSASSSPLEEIDVSNWDLSEIKSLNGVFAGNSYLQRIKGLETWDTSGVNNMSSMFQSASSLTELDLSNFNTENVTTMSSMFQSCSSLKEIDVSSFDTSNVTNMGTMFLSNSELTTIYVSDMFNTGLVTSFGGMFAGDTNLVGGKGTVYSGNKVNGDYARIDEEGNPGYFTNILDKTYKITYELNNGIGENRTGYTSRDDTFTLSNPTREGYTFLGWTGSNLTEPTIDVEIVKGTKGNLHFTANWKLIENTVISTPSSSGKGRVLPSKPKATTEEQEHNAADEKAETETESNNESENNQENDSLSQSEDNSAIYTPAQSVTVKQQVRKIASKTLTRGEVAVMTNVLIDVFPQLLTDKQEIKDNNECISFADEESFTSAEKSAATRLCKLGIMGIHADTKEQLDKFEAKKNATNNEFTIVIDRLLSSNNDKEISVLRNALKDRKNNEEGVKFRTVLESFIKIKNAIKK